MATDFIKHRNIATSRLRDAYSAARVYGSDGTALLADVKRVFDNLPKRTPEHVKSFLRGYDQCLREKLYEHDLVWAHVAPDGKRYTAHSVVPDWAESVDPLYKANRGAEIATWGHGHFWKHNGKPFFIDATADAVLNPTASEEAAFIAEHGLLAGRAKPETTTEPAAAHASEDEQLAQIRDIAREKYADDASIPDDAKVRQEQGGCFVQAEVWVENVYIEGDY